MRCPYCNSLRSEMFNISVCPHCGAVLPSYSEMLEQRRINSRNLVFPEPPIGVYKDAAGYLKIGKDSVTFFRKHFVKGHKREIPFNEIYAVSYESGKSFRPGFLCVREWKDRNLSLTLDPTVVATDETSVYFLQTENGKFRCAYEFLKQCAEIVNAANPDWMQGGLLSLMGRYKGFCGYMELGPDSVTFSKKALFMKPSERVIPYSEIAEVAFEKARGLGMGGLWIQEWKDRSLPIKANNASVDETAIDFSAWENERMQEVFEFLKHCADRNKLSPTYAAYEKKGKS